MKNVYLNAVISYSKYIKEAIAQAIPASARGTVQLRGTKAVILAILFILNGNYTACTELSNGRNNSSDK